MTCVLCCTACQVMDLLMEGSPLVGKLMENTHRFRTRMNEAGFNLGVRDSSCNLSNNLDSQDVLDTFTIVMTKRFLAMILM